MTIKSIIDVEIDKGGNFAKFNTIFQKYQTALKNQPKAWQAIAGSIDKTKQSFQELVAQEVAAIGKAKLLAEAAKVAERATREQVSYWSAMSRNTKDVAGNIKDSTASLLKWSSLAGVFTGLLGAGGLFGISRLAESASGARQQALGTGASVGERRSFQTNFGRFVDPDQFLGGVNQALTTPALRSTLYNGGLRDNELGGGSAQVGARLLDKIKALADQTDPSLLGAVHNARNLGQFLSPEAFQRLKNTKGEEYAKLRGSFGRDIASQGVGDDDLRKFQDFTTQMTRAGNEIEATFIKGLSPLAPALESLSKAVTGVVNDFLRSDGLKAALSDFTKYIGGQDFKDDLETVAKGFSKVAKGMAWLIGDKDPIAAASTAAREGIKSWWKENTGGGGAAGLAPAGGGAAIVKPGSGALDAGLSALAARIQGSISGVGPVTAGNDSFHKGRNSAHNDDRAFDLRLNDPSQSSIVAEKVREELRRLGIAGKVIDEYKNPSAGSTGGHLHVQTDRRVDIRIFENTGANVVVQAQQVAQ